MNPSSPVLLPNQSWSTVPIDTAAADSRTEKFWEVLLVETWNELTDSIHRHVDAQVFQLWKKIRVSLLQCISAISKKSASQSIQSHFAVNKFRLNRSVKNYLKITAPNHICQTIKQLALLS